MVDYSDPQQLTALTRWQQSRKIQRFGLRLDHESDPGLSLSLGLWLILKQGPKLWNSVHHWCFEVRPGDDELCCWADLYQIMLMSWTDSKQLLSFCSAAVYS